MQDTARKMAAIELLDADGNPVVLGNAWGKQLVVLVFIRHFG